jgi:hypothetical protein
MYINAFSLLSDDSASPVTESKLREVRDKYNLRRADRYSAMVLAGALQLNFEPHRGGADTALITASAFGPHRTTFATLDDILDYPEDQIMPTKFSHSLHNAAASYVSVVLGITGPAFAVTGFEDVWFEALSLAQTLLDSQLVHQAIVCGAEERALLTETAQKLLPKRLPCPLREGVITLLLSNDAENNRYGKIVLDRTGVNSAQRFFCFGCDLHSIQQIEKMSPAAVINIKPFASNDIDTEQQELKK